MTTPSTAPPARRAWRCDCCPWDVQSTTVLLLACEGAIPRFDVALLLDTGWEPRAVYANLERLAAYAEDHGIPVRQVSAGNIRADALDPVTALSPCPCTPSTRTGREGWQEGNVLRSTRSPR